MNPIIEVSQLRKSYQTYERGHTLLDSIKSLFHRKPLEIQAVKDISFSVQQGELIGFLGPNGAGKSTTLKILTGVLYPTDGHVSIAGYVPWKQRKPYVARIGAVFGQKSQLLWDIPPLDAFYMNKAIYGLKESDFRGTLDELVELLDVVHVIRKPTRQLSLGERMKCEFIMAMLHRPDIVFLDEPTIGLDVIAKEKIREFIKEMNRKGVTFILTTHDLGDVAELAKRVIVINHGEIIFDDDIAALKRHLGDKKLVKLTMTGDVPAYLGEGVAVLERLSSHEAKLEIDTAIQPLNAFIQMCSQNGVIADMSIEELPIEESIKALYSYNSEQPNNNTNRKDQKHVKIDASAGRKGGNAHSQTSGRSV